MKKFSSLFVFGFFLMVLSVNFVTGAPVVRQGSGANGAAIQAIVDQFRADLGGTNNGVGGSFKTGRREINWDAVPDSFSAPNFLPPNFFNSNSPRGAVFTTIEFENGGGLNNFIVSADSSNPTSTPVRFADIDPSYSAIFQTFSAERLFIARNTSMMEVTFFIPGSSIPATVSGFGVVFADVDGSSGGDRSILRCYLANGTQFASAAATAANNGLSFVGLSGNAGERISRCVIESGNTALGTGVLDTGAATDLVAMDDFIYGEPRAANFHPGDFDGDGFKDAAVFRPTANTFFILNSGSNTVEFIPFGSNGDIPVDGDFDGDRRADVAIFRPSVGEWWINRSSTGTTFATQFGSATDKPSVGDFDKDGITDLAFWRPSSGQYFIARSSTNYSTFFTQNWGVAGDLPVGAAIAP